MPRISLCLIARDEETFLPGCLESVRGVVDEIVLVDTGSQDRTREIASAAGARVFDFPWNDDFSAPRNEGIRRARGEWLLVLDADERLGPGAGKRLRRVTSNARFDVGMLPLHHASAVDASPVEVLAGRARIGNPMSLPRLLRAAGHPEYSGIIHESVEEWFLDGRRTAVLVDAPIVHLGAIPSLRDSRGKNERNLALLRRRCERAPDDLTALAYLASELFEIGDLDGASSAIEQGWAALSAEPSQRSVLRLAANRARLALQRGDPDTALAAMDVAERRHGPVFDVALLRALAWDLVARQGEHPAARTDAAMNAAAEYGRAIALHPVPSMEKLNGASLADIHVSRGHALLLAGRPDEAAADFETVLRSDPGSSLARLGSAEVALVRGDPLGALRLLEPLLAAGVSRPDAWLLASDAARALGARADADVFLLRANERVTRGFAAPHRELRHRTATGHVAPDQPRKVVA